ncbi:aminoglycoside phosphotransferase family protein [Rhizobium halophytocola]|uniref:Streptomycin 6-kinase n=1 Tax=Rhizobium halophytocola TaxID=735519 RepID=A0ABS4DY88_9HYPH|nr:aminoglycoside phosphotransferase family protein [Rhizobium halophytocola]MBP1850658.1 streptomycin 6-kinase [Rhizobium halophytocola]
MASRLSSDICQRWQLREPLRIADTFTSRIFRAQTPEGSRIVKQLKPAGERERTGMAYLRWRDGKGAVRLLDTIDDCYLLEDAGEHLLRDTLFAKGDVAATEILTHVLRALHAPAAGPPPPALLPLRAHFSELFRQAAKPQQPAIAALLVAAVPLAEALLADQTDSRPLHGDLHHENIIASSAGHWLAIDPQGLIGDPVYDVANVFGNPDGASSLVLAPERALYLARHFAGVFGCPPEKVLRHAIAHAALSVSWSLAQDLPPENQNIAERLAFGAQAHRLLTQGAV